MVFCNKELALISASVGGNHIANAGSLVNLGNIFLGMGKPQKAMKSLNKALKLRKAHLGDEHILTREVYELVLQTKAQMNCHKVAMNY
jgi:Tfp pilus assembly protein PilF